MTQPLHRQLSFHLGLLRQSPASPYAIEKKQITHIQNRGRQGPQSPLENVQIASHL